MNRLTSDKDVMDMGIFELAYNSCYEKDGAYRYRDYDSDIDIRQLAIRLLERYAGIPNEFTCDEDFDKRMMDYWHCGLEDSKGLIARLYLNLWGSTVLWVRLKQYEDTGLAPDGFLEMDKLYQELSKEVMQYRKIGTVEECREAVEKQRVKKPHGKYALGTLKIGECPSCHMAEVSQENFCGSCGQKLDWGDINEQQTRNN